MIDAWELIDADQTDTNSPLDQPLMDALRLRGDTLFDWVGKSYTPTDDHEHNGTDSSLMASTILADTSSAGSGLPFLANYGGNSVHLNTFISFYKTGGSGAVAMTRDYSGAQHRLQFTGTADGTIFHKVTEADSI